MNIVCQRCGKADFQVIDYKNKTELICIKCKLIRYIWKKEGK